MHTQPLMQFLLFPADDDDSLGIPLPVLIVTLIVFLCFLCVCLYFLLCCTKKRGTLCAQRYDELDDDAGNLQPTRRPVTVTQQAVVYSNFQNYSINDGHFPLTDRCGNFGGPMHGSHLTHGSGAVAQHTVNGAHPALVNYPISQQGIQPPHSNYGCIVQTTF